MNKTYKYILSAISIVLLLFAAVGIIGGLMGQNYSLILETYPPIRIGDYNSGPNVPLLVLGFISIVIGVIIVAYVRKRESQ